MNNRNKKNENNVNNMWGILAALMVGGLFGAGVMLFLAPQSGKKTRAKIRQKGMELLDETSEVVDDAKLLAEDKVRQIRLGVRKQTKELGRQGQALLDEQRSRLATIFEAGKVAVHDSRP
jgi:gas vesicle protein